LEKTLTDPKVSFIVPCYKLAHYLGDCVNSILSQTYGDFEIIIMDDCSPDNTPEAAAEFKDPRVIYIRNETNLGNIRNYNKGIELAWGRYIWLISADDCLRSQGVLQRYVDLLEKNPQVGYVFCPAITLRDDKEFEVEEWTAWPGDNDQIISGREIVRRSAYACAVSAPSGLVRRECYARKGLFRTDLPRASDYYLWAIFATIYDVGYFAEPMVYYRRHTSNMEVTMEREQPSFYYEQELLARWLIKKEAEKTGFLDLRSDFCRALAGAYTLRLAKKAAEDWQYGYTWDAAIQEIRANASDEVEAEEIMRLIRAGWSAALASRHSFVGATYYQMGRLDKAVIAFRSALTLNPWSIRPRIYLISSRLEQLFGVRFIPWLSLLRKVALRLSQESKKSQMSA